MPTKPGTSLRYAFVRIPIVRQRPGIVCIVSVVGVELVSLTRRVELDAQKFNALIDYDDRGRCDCRRCADMLEGYAIPIASVSPRR